MVKKESLKTKTSLKERLRPLEVPELREVVGGTRVRIPIGYTDDGQPIYGDDGG